MRNRNKVVLTLLASTFAASVSFGGPPAKVEPPPKRPGEATKLHGQVSKEAVISAVTDTRTKIANKKKTLFSGRADQAAQQKAAERLHDGLVRVLSIIETSKEASVLESWSDFATKLSLEIDKMETDKKLTIEDALANASNKKIKLEDLETCT